MTELPWVTCWSGRRPAPGRARRGLGWCPVPSRRAGRPGRAAFVSSWLSPPFSGFRAIGDAVSTRRAFGFALVPGRRTGLGVPRFDLPLPFPRCGSCVDGNAVRVDRERAMPVVPLGVTRSAPSVVSRLKTWVLCGGGGLSAAPPLLDDVPASPASRRLASSPPALANNPRF